MFLTLGSCSMYSYTILFSLQANTVVINSLQSSQVRVDRYGCVFRQIRPFPIRASKLCTHSFPIHLVTCLTLANAPLKQVGIKISQALPTLLKIGYNTVKILIYLLIAYGAFELTKDTKYTCSFLNTSWIILTIAIQTTFRYSLQCTTQYSITKNDNSKWMR